MNIGSAWRLSGQACPATTNHDREIGRDLANNEVSAILAPLGPSRLVRNLVRGSCLVSESEKSWLEFLVSSRNPRNIARSRSISRCTLPGQTGFMDRELAQKPALLDD